VSRQDTGIRRRPAGDASRAFRLDKGNGKVLGVCAGLGRYLGIDPLIVRVVFAVGALVGFGSFILIYFAIALFAD
jgi:phage shock protein PspC (stress-responsive transcriptional regulator)